MEVPKLGELAPISGMRDCIHLAVSPVMAGEKGLSPGSWVRLNEKGEAVSAASDAIGIVDPFLSKTFLDKGDRFWLCLIPGSITSLRHVWTHPAFKVKIPEVKGDQG